MKKKKSTKAKIRKIVRISTILFLSLLVAIFCYQKANKANKEILETTAKDAFVFQSIMLANSLDPDNENDYTDISSLEDDSDSFVSDAAIKTGKSEYYIRVNYGANCVNIYSKDDEGNYTVPYKAMICSTGKSTPKSGTYKITYKYRWLRLFGDVYGQYSTRIVKNILFHSVPYFKQRADTLEYEEYDKLGTTASAGCIRLTVQDAKWIYDNIPSGTYVEFYSDKDNPGPLGKPKAQKISDNEKCRDWDPTDPDKNNPWNGGSGIPSVTYTYQKNTNKNQNKNTNNKNTKTTQDNPNTTVNSNTSNKISTNTIVDKDNDNNKKPAKNEVVEPPKTTNTSTTNTTTSSNTSVTNTHKNTTTNTTNTSTKPNSQPSQNTTIDTSDKKEDDKKEDNKKPVEPSTPSTPQPNTPQPSTPPAQKPNVDNSTETQKPTQPPASTETPATQATTPEKTTT